MDISDIANFIFTEPTIIPDIFASGPAQVTILSGGFARLTFYADVPLVGIKDGRIEHRIVDRVVLAPGAVLPLTMMINQALGPTPYGTVLETQKLLARIGH